MQTERLWPFALTALVACQCSTSSAPPATTAPGGAVNRGTSPDSTGAVSTVSQALSQPSGTVVAVSGLYFGWKGPCKGMPPTRSAWQLVESIGPAAACIYVDGPAVAGVSPNAPPANVLVVVHGKYQIEGDMRYIAADSVDKK
jgi:hypothetical protein